MTKYNVEKERIRNEYTIKITNLVHKLLNLNHDNCKIKYFDAFDLLTKVVGLEKLDGLNSRITQSRVHMKGVEKLDGLHSRITRPIVHIKELLLIENQIKRMCGNKYWFQFYAILSQKDFIKMSQLNQKKVGDEKQMNQKKVGDEQ